MKNHLITITFLFCFCKMGFAQLGLSVGFSNITAQGWNEVLESQNSSPYLLNRVLSEGVHIGLDYQLKQRNSRIEYYPQIAYNRYIRIWHNDFEDFNADMALDLFQFSFAAKIYFLDLDGNTEQPLYMNKAPLLYKGLHITIAPNISLLKNSFSNKDGVLKSQDFSFGLTAGTGFDIPLAENLTITPYLNYHLMFNGEWENLDIISSGKSYNSGLDNNSEIFIFEFGIRTGINLSSNNEEERF